MGSERPSSPFPNSFTDEFHYSIDHRGRINFPAPFRRALSEASRDCVVVARGLDGCVLIFPKEVWEKYRAEFMASPYYSAKQQRRLQRMLFAGAKESVFDAQGRITVPASLIELAQLQKEVLIIGLGDRVEVWNPDVYKAYMAQSDSSIEAELEQFLTRQPREPQ